MGGLKLQKADFRFSGGQSLLGGFNAVVHRISNEMIQRGIELFKDIPIHFVASPLILSRTFLPKSRQDP